MILSWEDFVSEQTKLSGTAAASIGVFDGVHLGHQTLISKVLEGKKDRSFVFTFNINPKLILGNSSYLGNITTLKQKIKILLQMGIDTVVVIDFSPDFSKLSGEDFLNTICLGTNLELLVLGENFRFGYQGKTDVRNAKDILDKKGVDLNICSMAYLDNDIISSTRIRKSIRNGNIKEAGIMLDRVFSLDLAEKPQISKGKTISIDIGNIQQVLPPQGHYVVTVYGEGGVLKNASCEIDNKNINVDIPGDSTIVSLIEF